MFTFSIHGLRAQEVESCTKILGTSGFLSKMEVQDIIIRPIEKKGSVTSGYIKMSKEPIVSKEIPEDFDFTLILDPNVPLPEIVKKCKPKSILIINTTKKINLKNIKTYKLDAIKLALDNNETDTGMPILGAFIKIYPKISIKTVKDVLKNNKTPQGKINMIDAGFKEVKV